MNNPFDYTPDAECREAFRRLTVMLEGLRENGSPEDARFLRELDAGKMLGVMIAADEHGKRHTLYAFSGQVGNGGFHYPGFVGPAFDYLEPGGYFKTKEAQIVALSAEIADFESGQLQNARANYENARKEGQAKVEAFKEKCRLSKIERSLRRNSGHLDEVESETLIRQSQFEKAELHRLKKRMAEELEPYAEGLKNTLSSLNELKERRRSESEVLQKWLFSNFILLNARGEGKSLNDIFASTPMGIPPSGAGECCGPKLIQEVYKRGWRPVAMAEYWYGKSKGGEVRIAGAHYPACRGKCLPVLGWMLQGLDIRPPLNADGNDEISDSPEILFENQWFCVVNKPSGMLSVPGKGKAVSVQQWLSDRYGVGAEVKMAHRLDRDTSGLLLATFGARAYKEMQALFAGRKVKKIYVADLEGDYEAKGIAGRGYVSLPLIADWNDRPRQRIDMENGKEAVTYYEFIGKEDGRSRVEFFPHTGRTHQLRVHAASDQGLGMPIVGDLLYGDNKGKGEERLRLHACRLEFIFPLDGQAYCFECAVPF